MWCYEKARQATPRGLDKERPPDLTALLKTWEKYRRELRQLG